MAPDVAIRRAIAVARAGLAVALLTALSGCAGTGIVGGKPKFTLKVSATKRLNTGGTAVAYPLKYTWIQLTDPAPLTGMTVEQLWDKWTTLPGGVFLSAGPVVTITPDSTRTEDKVEIDEKAGAIVVVGKYGKAGGPCFYHVQPVPRKKRKSISLTLTADSTCFFSGSR